VTPAPGAATIRARRVSVKLPLPVLADTGFGTTPRLVAVPAACFAEAESACTAKTAPGTPIASTEKPADQTDKTARRCRQDHATGSTGRQAPHAAGPRVTKCRLNVLRAEPAPAAAGNGGG